MDLQNVGSFLSELRRERNMTQEQLGQRLGVTNKTVFRWENGNYLPPVEMLQQLSEIYGISINELLSGQRLAENDYRLQAEENIKSALNCSSFTLKERIAFFKKKWKKEHFGSLIAGLSACIGLYMWGFRYDGRQLQMIATVLAFIFIIWRYNAMMAYVERRAFDPVENEETDIQRRQTKAMVHRRLEITGLIFLAVTMWIFADLTYNYFSALVPQLNDGLTVRGIFAPLIFGMDGINWTIINYFRGFVGSLFVMVFTGISNIILRCWLLNRTME